jgi:tetratricopeptide (TPR) repeat protein
MDGVDVAAPGSPAVRAAGIVWLAAAIPLLSPGRRLARDGQKQFERKHYAAAEKRFEEARKAEPGDPLWSYDLGTARAWQGKSGAAREALERAAGSDDPATAAGALYQLGTMDLGRKQFPEAVASLKRALELDPSREDARRNFEIALREARKKAPPKSGSPPPRARPQAPRPSPAPVRPRPDSEFEKKAGMTRAEAEAMLRALDAEQRNPERARPRPGARDW